MISTPLDLQSQTARAALTFLTAGLYGLAYVPLSDHFGAGVSVLIAIPVIVAAWSFGLWAGLVAGLLAFPLNTLLLKVAGEPGGNVLVRSGGMITLAVVALIGAVIGWLGDLRERQLKRELAARQRVERSLHDSELRFRRLFETAQDGILLLDAHTGQITEVNPFLIEMLGYSRGEFLGKKLWEIGAVKDIEPSRIAFRELQEKGYIRYENLPLQTKDGRRIHVEFVSNVYRVDDTKVIQCNIRDITKRKERSADQFRLAIESAPTGMLMVDRSGTIVLVNAQIERLFGYERAELIGKPVETLVPERFRGRHPEYRTGFSHEPKARPMGGGRDLYGLRKDGTEVPIEIGLNPLRTTEGDFVLSSVTDVTERKRAEREEESLLEQLKTLNADLEERVRARTSELTASLKERDVLLQEVHHRVKNNLQVISSLINMQVRRLEAGTSRDALEACQTRVQTIALIHQTLYQAKDYARVPFSEYAQSLASNVFHATGVSPTKVSLDLAIGDVALPVDKAIPCGLLLNELITNALKHAFTDGRSGTIRVAFGRIEGGRLRLTVSDDGVGLPQGYDVRNSESLGLQLVSTLSDQLDAELEIDGRGGATFQLTFPAEN